MIAELRTFVAVARLGSFAAAARQTRLTQSAVSAQIRRLEQEFGYGLFRRTGRSITLSTRGQAALERAEGLLAEYDGFKAEAHDLKVQGLLRIGTISTTQTTIIAPALAALHTELPELQFHVLLDASLVLLSCIDAGELDAGVMVRPPFGLPAHMNWTTLATQKYVLIAPENISGEDWRHLLNTQRFIRYASGSFGGQIVNRFLKSQCISTGDLVETEALNTILQMVARNMGVAIVPHIFPVSIMPNIRVLPLGDHAPVRELGVMTPKGPTSPVKDRMLFHLQEAALAHEVFVPFTAGEEPGR
ncbi:transcriptional regulator LysR [Gluconobacter thailandicus F149-1 = NBRC 100600]|uniref:LysR family transcriptional regulator n=1 Tax=Gluconobacter thailandicus NBRC 3257 TaxID=1381097 RepID=A0ABQ0ISX6_GLUTH|nr:LysR family transcriptional regulator [Gluconobacter thailandicus]AFW02601.1 LysR family transcriptional regulator [Gluconobacter oxydans H24]ANQ41915.1 LysR family transcriptional regulator [Gluconobacter oxydans]GAN91606.1 transcriptional regulator LysR [Gluconobacter frateurii M-2]KXV55113.1 LysR family transcriptional regulator [Gluconobacter thailandicus]GAD25310.1 LysR family transcriptional regulator [Gluconobacter thailandicus NBRC 3257]